MILHNNAWPKKVRLDHTRLAHGSRFFRGREPENFQDLFSFSGTKVPLKRSVNELRANRSLQRIFPS
jgi:hypothetical protein